MSLPANAEDGGARGSRWGSLQIAALFSPLTLLPTLIVEHFVLSSSLWRTRHLSAQLSPSVHLCSIRSPFPLTAHVFSLLIVPQNPRSIQYCNTVVIHKYFWCRHCSTCLLTQPALLSNCQNELNLHQTKLLTEHCPANRQRDLCTLFALFPSRNDLERLKWKRKQEVRVSLSIPELHKHSQRSQA